MSNPDAMRQALLAFGEEMGALLDFLDGHRAELERRGYSPTAAEQMVLAMHAKFVAMLGTKQ